jgi:predicted transcriptional regulator
MARYTIDVDQDFDRLLTNLAREKGSTKADVIRRAVSSYSYLIKETSNDPGKKVSITSPEDKVLKDVILA